MASIGFILAEYVASIKGVLPGYYSYPIKQCLYVLI